MTTDIREASGRRVGMVVEEADGSYKWHAEMRSEIVSGQAATYEAAEAAIHAARKEMARPAAPRQQVKGSDRCRDCGAYGALDRRGLGISCGCAAEH